MSLNEADLPSTTSIRSREQTAVGAADLDPRMETLRDITEALREKQAELDAVSQDLRSK
jgi:hypothetical protein